jgi:hypothetical protein
LAAPTRTQRISAKSIAAIPADSILFIGMVVLIADTGYELYSDLGMVHYTDTAITSHVKKTGKHQKRKLYSCRVRFEQILILCRQDGEPKPFANIK